MVGIIWCHTVKSQAENDFFRHLLQAFFIVFLYHFSPVLYTVVNYPNTWFARSFLARSANQRNKIYNKIQNIWFQSPVYSVLQLSKQCLRKNVVLLNFCLCVYSVWEWFLQQTNITRIYGFVSELELYF